MTFFNGINFIIVYERCPLKVHSATGTADAILVYLNGRVAQCSLRRFAGRGAPLGDPCCPPYAILTGLLYGHPLIFMSVISFYERIGR